MSRGARYRRLLAMALLLCLAVTSLTVPTAAASGLTLYADPATLGNGDDYATNVLHDPWDMNKLTDIGWWENYADITVQNGVWSARTAVTNPYGGSSGLFYPLFQGFAGALNPGRTGANYPIDTTRYTQLSYRLYLDHRQVAGKSAVHRVDWTHSVNWPDGSNMFAFADSSADGWKIYNFDMNAVNGDLGNQKGSWSSSPVYGFDIIPSALNPSANIGIDWVRLTDPKTSPRYHLSWSGAADANVEVYVDTDGQGYDGSKVATVAASLGAYDFPTCVLPGGVYYFYLKSGTATSNYAGPLTINNPPVLQWDQSTLGDDYAATELGDPWDMNGPEDLATLQGSLASDANYQFRQFYNWDFTNGVFSATADSSYAYTHYSSVKQSDVQVWLNIDPNRPIDPRKYHYLMLRIMVDNPGSATLSQLVQDGWICRVVWWNQDIHTDGYASDGWILYPGWNTIIIDLAKLGVPMSGDPYPANRLWNDMGKVTHLRIDPLEVSTDTRFHIDEVRLLSDPVVRSSMAANLVVGDPDGQQVTLRYYYDSAGRGFNGQELVSSARAPVLTGQFLVPSVYIPLMALNPRPALSPLLDEPGFTRVTQTLDLSGLANGTYYIYACASDGVSQTCAYLPTPLVVSH